MDKVMRNKIFYFLLISLCSFSFLSCEKEEGITKERGVIYGFVIDDVTGEPVANANVQLRPSGETTLTGYDGKFEILDIAEGYYSISVSKSEYNELIDDNVIAIKNGLCLRHDLQINKQRRNIRITDMKGNDIWSLEFSSDASIDILSFNIYNDGTDKMNCNIAYSCDWVKSISPISSTIAPGDNTMITVRIDRTKLSAGQNSTVLRISSDSKNAELLITANAMQVIPSVLTLPVTNKGLWSYDLHAEVTNTGKPEYYKRGFCYSINNPNPTINDNNVEIQGTGIGEYSYHLNIPWSSSYGRYYVRSWLMYGTDNIVYGNVVSFYYDL